MNRKIFETCVPFFTENLAARTMLHFIYKVLPYAVFVLYPVLLLNAFFYAKETLLRLVLVPAGVFLGVSLLRVIVNEERPYERYGMPSVFNKTTKGKSFPSRHTASAFIIAMAFWYVNVPMGVVAMVIAILIELSRILAGAHYVHDVVASMLISLAAGYVFFFLI